MKMRGIIHIGAEKTGTTALQEFFTEQRDHLRVHGITYPGFAGHRQHSLLAFYCMDPGRENHQTRMNPALGSSQRDHWKHKFRASVCRELMDSGGRPDLLVSTELFHSKLASCEEIQRLKSLLDLWCEDYRVVFYMRRQDELAVSLYSTYLRTGGTRHEVLQPRAQPIHYYDYERILGNWEAVFGAPRIIPRLFDRTQFIEGDLVSDFFSATGLGHACLGRERPPRRNTALSRNSQVLLLELNKRLPDPESPEQRQRQQRFRRRVADILETTGRGPSARPSPRRGPVLLRTLPPRERTCGIEMVRKGHSLRRRF
jgi:hypothetical protein